MNEPQTLKVCVAETFEVNPKVIPAVVVREQHLPIFVSPYFNGASFEILCSMPRGPEVESFLSTYIIAAR